MVDRRLCGKPDLHLLRCWREEPFRLRGGQFRGGSFALSSSTYTELTATDQGFSRQDGYTVTDLVTASDSHTTQETSPGGGYYDHSEHSFTRQDTVVQSDYGSYDVYSVHSLYEAGTY